MKQHATEQSHENILIKYPSLKKEKTQYTGSWAETNCTCDQHKLLMTDQTHVAVKCLLFDSVLKNSYGLLEIGNQLFRWS